MKFLMIERLMKKLFAQKGQARDKGLLRFRRIRSLDVKPKLGSVS